MSAPVVSVLIPTRGRVARLEKTLAALWAKATDPTRVEIIVHVHEDDPETRAWAERRDKRVRMVMSDTAGGYGSVYKYINALASVSDGDWLMTMSDEYTILTEGWESILHKRLAQPRKECLLLTAKVTAWPDSRSAIMSRGLYHAIGHMGMTEYGDCYIDSLTHFAELQEKSGIEYEEGAMGAVCPRNRMKTWGEYRSRAVADCFEMDKKKLGAVLGKSITVNWTPLDAPEKPSPQD